MRFGCMRVIRVILLVLAGLSIGPVVVPAIEAEFGRVPTGPGRLPAWNGMRGRLVKTLVDEEKTPGRYELHWDGKDVRGQFASSGVYICRVEAGEFEASRKMLLAR